MSENNFVVQWEEFTPRWFVEGIDNVIDNIYVDIFAGIPMYDPDGTESVSLLAGGAVYQKGTNKICVAKSNITLTPPDSVPSSSNNNFYVYTIKEYIDTKVPKTTTVNGHALNGPVTVTKSDVGLGNADNTSDANKPVSTAQQAALDLKAPKASPEFTGSISLGRKSGSTIGANSLAVGEDVVASGANSHAEGESRPGIGAVPTAYTTASGQGSHAEGGGTTASGLYSHAEGERSSATAEASHAEGQSSATGILSHAEGASTASGLNSHAEGSNTEAGGSFSHAENWGNFAIGDCSHAEGHGTLVKRYAQHSFGTYNVADETGADKSAKGKYIEIVGNGEGVNAKSNARTLDWNGNERIMGDLYIGCNADSTGGTKLGDALALKAPLASPVLTGTPKSVTPTSSSNAKMIATKEYVDNAFTTFDAMLYKGVVNQNSDLPATHKRGWTYKVGTAGTYVGIVCEVGDMIVCNTAGTSANNSHWDVIQTNIDGAVIGPASSTNNHVALFNGTTGKVIKDGGTIQSLIIDDNASGSGASSKVWSAQKLINELVKKVNETDLFAGIDIYDPNSASQGQFVFNANAYAHQVGTNYIVHNTDEGVYVVPPANLIDACLSYETLTLTEYIQRIADNTIDDTAGNGNTGKTWSADKIYDQLALKAPKASPVFTGSISLGRYSETIGDNSIAVGYQVSAAGENSSAFGRYAYASDRNQHVVGRGNYVYAVEAWQSDKTYHPGEWVSRGNSNYECRVENTNTAPPNSTYWFERMDQTSNYVELVGNGDMIVQSNARALDWDGNERLMGNLYVGCNADSTGGSKVLSVSDFASSLEVSAIISEYGT